MGVRESLQTKKGRIILIVVAVCLIIVATILLIVGIIQIKNRNCENTTASAASSKEGERFIKFLNKVKKTYYAKYPHTIIYDPDVNLNTVIDNFHPYNPKPSVLKDRTDLAYQLRKELTDLKLDLTKLKPRAKKAVAQLEHYLDSIFGNPYNENYYAGDWMMGPNYFCWQHICDIGSDLRKHYKKENGVVPKTFEDVETMLATIKKYKDTIEQYQQNMDYGVKAGMVRAVDDCKSGKNAFKSSYGKIAELGEQGALKESFSYSLISASYYDKLTSAMKSKFKAKYGKDIEKEMSDVIVSYIGKPLSSFMKYLESNYSRHCVPPSVASGLGNLPLDKVWLDQTETSQATTKRLPTGELLDGKKSYDMILPYFTTSKRYTAKTIYELGIKQRDKLYAQAEVIAKKITNKTDSTAAVAEFAADLNMAKHFFNDSVIPDNENDEEGGRRCKDMKTAKINCPVRYKAMQAWFAYAQQLLSKIEPMTVGMFYMTGEKGTTPNCPVKMRAKFNPSSGSQSYSSAGVNCTRPCYYQLPFFLKRPGPKYSAYSVAGHEGRPGHHTQVQGFDEHFAASGKKDVIDWLNGNNYYTAFTEGWALYAENPLLAKETNLYEGEPVQEYGMLKWQIWRALRLIIDTGLHARGITQQSSLDMFKKYAWDTTDKSNKDTIRYMSSPGQATAYMIGQLSIWNMRNKVEQEFLKNGVNFDEKEFHYQILSQGSSPLDYLIGYIDNYIECKIDGKARTDCPEILDPKLASQQKSEAIGTASRWEFIEKNRYKEHFD